MGSLCESINKKTKIVQKVTLQEANNYDNLVMKIEEKIEKTKIEIDEVKLELEHAKKIRRNRLEYDAMANYINSSMNRSVTGAKIEEIRSEIMKLKEEEELVNDKFQHRQKQFLVLLQSVNRLQEMLDEDMVEDGCNNSSDLKVSNQKNADDDSQKLVNVSNSSEDEMDIANTFREPTNTFKSD